MTSPQPPASSGFAGDALAVESSADPRLAERIASLSPAKRQLLERWLADRNVDHAPVPIIGSRRRDGSTSDEVAAPLSFQQESLWLVDQLDPGTTALNTPGRILRLRGRLDAAALQQAFDFIVLRHPTLRTVIQVHEGAPVQIVRPIAAINSLQSAPSPALLPVHDLSQMAEASRWAEAMQMVEGVVRYRYDLSADLMVQAVLVRLGVEDHILAIGQHHIASDFWSAGIFMRELAAAYEALAAGRSPDLPSLPVQYTDYAIWQREYLSGARLQQHLDYWRRQLQGAEPLNLLTDWPRPARRSFAGSSESLELSAESSQAITVWAKRHGFTTYQVLLAGYLLLLHKYSGQEDLLIGSMSANRMPAEVEGLVGYFIRAFPVRARLQPGMGFGAWVQQVRDSVLEALDHEAPYTQVVAAAHPERDPGRSSLIQVILNYANVPRSKATFAGLDASIIRLPQHSSEWELGLLINDEGNRLHFHATYRTDLFSGETIRTLLESYAHLLAAGIANPDAPMRALSPLTPTQRQGLLERGGGIAGFVPRLSPRGGGAPDERESWLHRRFEQQAHDTPDAPAVRCGEETLSYSALDDIASRLAHHLQDLGVGPESLVGLWAEPSTSMIAGMLGILKAGGAFVPLDPDSPAKRLQRLCKDTGIGIVCAPDSASLPATPDWTIVSTTGLPDTRIKAANRVPSLRLGPLPSGQDPQPTTHNSQPSSLALARQLVYVLFTSGSTGQPKGVMVEHEQLLSYVLAIRQRLELGAGESFAMVQPLTVDSCHTMVFPALGWGGCLHLVPRQMALDPEALAGYMARHSIDHLKIAPSHLRALMQAQPSAHLLPRRTLVIGGEASGWELVKQVRALSGSCAIWNHYGPTETTVGVLTYPLPLGLSLGTKPATPRAEPRDEARHPLAARGEADGPASLPLGAPLAGVRAYVLDSAGQLALTGAAGELYFGGDLVGRGYLNRPGLTAQAFLPDPFSSEPGARMYRTGDRGRWLWTGEIEFLGRFDDQVKIRGFRIEPAEIAAVLGEHPAVAERAVLPIADSHGEKSLAAFIVLQPTSGINEKELRAWLRQRLPEPMIPSSFVLLDAMPRTPHGKIDRQRLAALAAGSTMGISFSEASHSTPPLAAAATDVATMTTAPATPTEIAIAAIWQEMLGRGADGGQKAINVDDDFFDLGGHSLLAAQMVYRLREAFDSDLPVRRLFETPTIAGLAAYIEEHKATRTEHEAEGAPHPQPATRNSPPARRTLGTTFGDGPARGEADGPATRSLLPIHTHGALPPFFFLAGGGGSEDEYLTAYAGLLHRLRHDQPVYGFQARGIDDGLEPHQSVLEMAADFVAEMRAVQPHGPYFLGGECVGGKLALEMGRVLLDQGEEPALVVLLNCMVKGLAATALPVSEAKGHASHGWQQIDRRLKELRRLPTGQRLPRLGLMARNAAAVLLPVTEAQRQGRERRAAKLHYTNLLKSHQIDPYPGDIVLMMTEELVARGHAEAWGELVRGQLIMQTLQGLHRTYLGEFVDANAAALRACLEQAHAVTP